MICNRDYGTPRGLAVHVMMVHRIESREYYVRYIDPTAGRCHCGTDLPFRGMREGFRKFCSRSCSNRKNFAGKTRAGPRFRPARSLFIDCECCKKTVQVFNGRQKACSECCPNEFYRGVFHRYRIGKKQYDTLVEQQNGTCALCPNPFQTIDHCHKTGQVRGLLCFSCNLFVAAFDKDPEWIIRAQNYVERT